MISFLILIRKAYTALSFIYFFKKDSIVTVYAKSKTFWGLFKKLSILLKVQGQ